MDAVEAVLQALRMHRQAGITPTGIVCSCGALVALGDFDLHVARHLLNAVEDATSVDLT
jgi:hypothetical protein